MYETIHIESNIESASLCSTSLLLGVPNYAEGGSVLKSVCVCLCFVTAVVQMTTVTGLSSIASLSLGLSMSLSSGQPGDEDRTAKLKSQLSMIAAPPPPPNDAVAGPKHRRASLGTPPSTAGRPSPSPRPPVKRQAALLPSPISERSPLNEDPAVTEHQDPQDGSVTVMSF